MRGRGFYVRFARIITYWEFYLMKMRKITAFLTALVAILASFSFLNPTFAKADEEGGSTSTTVTVQDFTSTAKFVSAYKSYKSNYLFSELTSKASGTFTEEFNYNEYTYSLKYEPTFFAESDFTADENETAAEKLEKEVKKYSAEVKVTAVGDSGSQTIKDGAGDDVKFKAEGAYKATLYRAKKSGSDQSAKEFATVTFEVVNESTVDSDALALKYKTLYEDDLKKYVDLVKTEVESVDYGDDFQYPELRDLVSVNYFDYSDLELTLFYTTPSQSGFSKVSPSSSSSSKKFELDEIGYYSFYVALSDPYGKAAQSLDLSGLTAKQEDGQVKYYEDDATTPKFTRKSGETLTAAEGEEKDYKGYSVDWLCDGAGKELCPIFTFNYVNAESAEPKVEIESAADTPKGYHKLVYKSVDKLLTITSVDSKTTNYRLYYSDSDVTSGEKWMDEGVRILAEGAQDKEFNTDDLTANTGVFDVTDVDIFDFSTSTRYFTVAAKGYYYVVCEVGTDFGTVAVCTNAINATNEFSSVKYVRDWGKFLENNTTAVIFLGIAVLSFIGLMLVIFIKPKDKNAAKENALPENKG